MLRYIEEFTMKHMHLAIRNLPSWNRPPVCVFVNVPLSSWFVVSWTDWEIHEGKVDGFYFFCILSR